MGKRQIRTGILLLSALFAFVFSSGCIPVLKEGKRASSQPSGSTAAPAPKDKKTPSDLVHMVKWQGESLSIIAKWYTGDVRNWKTLAEYNPLNDPDRIRIGDRVSIPETLGITREPLPKWFVESHMQRPEQSSPDEPLEPAEPAPEEDPPELFGPRDLKGD